MAWSAWLSAELAGVPVVAFDLGAWPSEFLSAIAGDHFERARASLGLPPDPDFTTLDPWLNLVGGPPGWFPLDRLPAVTRLFQPPDYDARDRVPAPDRARRDSDRPLVYATLGTTFNTTPGLFEMIFEALAEEPLQVIATVGPGIDPRSYGPLADNLVVEPYIPQSLVLAQCDAVIAHAGYGSLMGALGRGRPIVTIPLAPADHAFNASRIGALGAGIVIAGAAWSPNAIRTAIWTILRDPAYRLAAEGVARSIAALPPIERAAVLIEQVASDSRDRTRPAT
jgi:UDP:flavonoid glycosyltransferase YjiC (YdhE family)